MPWYQIPDVAPCKKCGHRLQGRPCQPSHICYTWILVLTCNFDKHLHMYSVNIQSLNYTHCLSTGIRSQLWWKEHIFEYVGQGGNCWNMLITWFWVPEKFTTFCRYYLHILQQQLPVQELQAQTCNLINTLLDVLQDPTPSGNLSAEDNFVTYWWDARVCLTRAWAMYVVIIHHCMLRTSRTASINTNLF